MGTWKWIQPSGKVFKVVSNCKKGTIHVFDENDKLVMVKKNLSEDAIKLVEKSFLDIVAKNENKKFIEQNPMYA